MRHGIDRLFFRPTRGVARIFQRGGHRGYSSDHHPGIADYIWSGAYNPERSTAINSCNGVFTSEFIFR